MIDLRRSARLRLHAAATASRDVVGQLITGAGGAWPLTMALRADAELLVRDAVDPSAVDRRVHEALEAIHSLVFTKPPASDRGLNRRALLGPAQEVLEGHVISFEDQFIDSAEFDTNAGPDRFVSKLKRYAHAHPASQHPFYIEYLPARSRLADLRFYLAQETALDPRFDDFIALMQLGARAQAKMEFAQNYWDEMGNGVSKRVHTSMFTAALSEVGATPNYVEAHRLPSTIACGNLSASLVLSPHLYYRAIGSFAVTEFLFPGRCSRLVRAWERNGLSASGAEYHREHIGVDARHASGFFRNVIKPELAAVPGAASEIFWGVAARLNSSKRYLDELIAHLSEATEARA